MNYLLDTHTLLWWWGEPEKLSATVEKIIKNRRNGIFVSAASALEISTKTRIGKLPHGHPILDTWDERLKADAFNECPITSKHGLKAGMLSGDHRDPFDRLLASQSIIEGLAILGCDQMITSFGVTQIW